MDIFRVARVGNPFGRLYGSHKRYPIVVKQIRNALRFHDTTRTINAAGVQKQIEVNTRFWCILF